MGAPITVTAGNFDSEVLQSDSPVLVDFWAPWCGPCRVIAPAVEELATEYDGKLKVGKLNVDDHPAIAQNYGITGIPALLFFKDGKRVDTVVGAVSKDVLQGHVKLGLFFLGRGGGRAGVTGSRGYGYGHGRGGSDAELFLQRLYQVGQFQHAHALDSFQQFLFSSHGASSILVLS